MKQKLVNAIVIDDNNEDILGVSEALATAGIATIPIHHKPFDIENTKKLCKIAASSRSRVIITDIQLNEPTPTPTPIDIASVTSCLCEIVSITTGPYIILAWTSVPESFDSLKEYFYKYLKKMGYNNYPLVFESICKVNCRNPDDGSYDLDRILEKVSYAVESKETFNTLLFWEKSINRAAANTINEIFVDDKQDHILRELMTGVVGKDNIKGKESFAINEGLSYLLKDKIMNLTFEEAEWPNIDLSQVTGLTPVEEFSLKAKLNTNLHIDQKFGRNQNGISRGDILNIDESSFFNIFCDDIEDIDEFEKSLKGSVLKQEKISTCFESFICMEISPACDIAQNKKKLKSFVLGMIINLSKLDDDMRCEKKLKNSVIKTSDGVIYLSFMLNNKEHLICFFKKYSFSLSDKKLSFYQERKVLEKRMRIRESMLLSLIQDLSAHNSRIGVISSLL